MNRSFEGDSTGFGIYVISTKTLRLEHRVLVPIFQRIGDIDSSLPKKRVFKGEGLLKENKTFLALRGILSFLQ